MQSLDNASIVRELLSFHQPHFEGGHGEGRGAAQHGEDAAYEAPARAPSPPSPAPIAFPAAEQGGGPAVKP